MPPSVPAVPIEPPAPLEPTVIEYDVPAVTAIAVPYRNPPAPPPPPPLPVPPPPPPASTRNSTEDADGTNGVAVTAL
ncbi:MAG: hypothetical protein EBT15_12630 [Betaproteobacteria bacterium]|nr:hypothetical protein [Betaproteobacteria bacterium]